MRLSHFMIAIVAVAFAPQVRSAAAQTAPKALAEKKKESAPAPVPIAAGKVQLTPKNTTIQFVGLHTGEEPNPRIGYFATFAGELSIDEATGAPESAELKIETASLVTPIGKLTGHLHSPDFFDVRQFPTATFKTTKIDTANAAAGKYTFAGELAIRDVTRPITFPAMVKVTGAGAVLTSKFKIKRSEFGLAFGPDRIVEEVALTVTVGKPTPKVEQE